jgi:hypothetical protein
MLSALTKRHVSWQVRQVAHIINIKEGSINGLSISVVYSYISVQLLSQKGARIWLNNKYFFAVNFYYTTGLFCVLNCWTRADNLFLYPFNPRLGFRFSSFSSSFLRVFLLAVGRSFSLLKNWYQCQPRLPRTERSRLKKKIYLSTLWKLNFIYFIFHLCHFPT